MLCACALGMLMLLRACGRNARVSGFVCASAAGMLACQEFVFARAAGVLARQEFFWERKGLAGPQLECESLRGQQMLCCPIFFQARNWKTPQPGQRWGNPVRKCLTFLCPWKVSCTQVPHISLIWNDFQDINALLAP